ncbi:DUF5020 family protein [Endozoicomonas sp. 8E]|uniref:DUF5020 family protein n=1 Tax=Endozoicomonas sp. 8E TaxID=3035692 RepID=UPI002938F4F6|nr:DUF5020 family protein [Endozoicomonas sp. 8E]WOG29769.1 DUF5020 family protein [Endozoicomonas sp. 8E]
MKLMKQAAIAATIAAASTGAQADILWSNVSATYLTGDGYLNAFSEQEGKSQVVTLEHAAAYTWGKSFSFVDRSFVEDDVDNDDTYGEVHIDFSLTGGEGFKDSVIKDVYLATQWEHAATVNLDNILLGGAIGWNVPGFIFLDTAVYYRANGKDSFDVELDDNFQFTTAWAVPFSLGSTKWLFDGFVDITNATENNSGEDVEMQIIAQPQLKLDVGHFFGKGGKYYAGIEYNYWKNKLGRDGQDQNLPQFIVQANF